jgi:hypothetical protein
MILIGPSVIICAGRAQNGSPNIAHPHLSRFAESELGFPARVSPFSLQGLMKRMTKTKEHTMKNLFTSAIAASFLIAFVSVAQARSAYDGSWDLLFVTQRGACDPTYNFSVNITDGVVTHPNLVKFRGHVAGSGAVRASVTVPDKYASGSGRLSSNSGRGTWWGNSGGARCSGYWTAQRN